MLKGIAICLCLLVTQLAMLSWIDHRLSGSESVQRQVTSVQASPRTREDDDAELG